MIGHPVLALEHSNAPAYLLKSGLGLNGLPAVALRLGRSWALREYMCRIDAPALQAVFEFRTVTQGGAMLALGFYTLGFQPSWNSIYGLAELGSPRWIRVF